VEEYRFRMCGMIREASLPSSLVVSTLSIPFADAASPHKEEGKNNIPTLSETQKTHKTSKQSPLFKHKHSVLRDNYTADSPPHATLQQEHPKRSQNCERNWRDKRNIK
jgi:hypothetical protein